MITKFGVVDVVFIIKGIIEIHGHIIGNHQCHECGNDESAAQ